MDKVRYLSTMADAWCRCRACPRLADRKNAVFGEGNPDAGIVIVGEAPGATEEETGLPFVGKAGNFLDLILAETSARPEVIQIVEMLHGKRLNIEDMLELRRALRGWLYQDFFFTNTVMCRPPENVDPIPQETDNCKTRLFETIYTIDPLIIIACGRIAAEVLLQVKNVNISRSRGQVIDTTFQGRGTQFTYPVIPIFHSSYLMRKNDHNSDDGDTKKTFQDVLLAMHIYDELKLRHDGTPKPATRPSLDIPEVT